MERFHECYALVGAIDALAAGTGASTTDVIDARDAQEIVFVINVGTVAATGTVDFVVNTGTVTGTVTTSLTAITQLGASDDNKQVIVSVLADALPAGGRYVQGALTRGTANSNAAVNAYVKKAYRPGNEADLASVDEIVVVG